MEFKDLGNFQNAQLETKLLSIISIIELIELHIMIFGAPNRANFIKNDNDMVLGREDLPWKNAYFNF